MPIFTPPKSWFLGSKHLNVIGHHRDPKRHILGQNRTYMPILVQIGPLVQPRRELKESKRKKKGKERNLQWQTGCSRRPPTLTQRYVVLHAGWSSVGSYNFPVSSKSVERFSRCGGRNLPFPVPKASGLYNSFTSRDVILFVSVVYVCEFCV